MMMRLMLVGNKNKFYKKKEKGNERGKRLIMYRDVFVWQKIPYQAIPLALDSDQILTFNLCKSIRRVKMSFIGPNIEGNGVNNTNQDSITLGQLRTMVNSIPKPKVRTHLLLRR